VYFAAGMAVPGFLLCQNVIVGLLVALMEAVFLVARIETYSGWWVLGLLMVAVVIGLWFLTH
jgi:hypothetical protein